MFYNSVIIVIFVLRAGNRVIPVGRVRALFRPCLVVPSVLPTKMSIELKYWWSRIVSAPRKIPFYGGIQKPFLELICTVVLLC